LDRTLAQRKAQRQAKSKVKVAHCQEMVWKAGNVGDAHTYNDLYEKAK